jgi:hypothetical protein
VYYFEDEKYMSRTDHVEASHKLISEKSVVFRYCFYSSQELDILLTDISTTIVAIGL